MNVEKSELIDLLTGVKSSKKTYYTELKKTVDQLKKKNTQLEILHDLTNSIRIDMSIEEILRNVISKLNELIQLDDCHLFLSIENEMLHHIYPKGGCKLEIKIPDLYKESFENKQPIHIKVHELSNKHNEKNLLLSLNMQSLLFIPLYGKDTPIGVLSFGRKNEQTYTEDELEFLKQLASQLSITLENSTLYKRVLQAKQEWEDTFKAVDDMIIVFNHQIEIHKYNDSTKNFSELPLLVEQIKPFIQTTFTTHQPEYQEIHLSGKIILEMHTYPIQNHANEVYGVLCYLKNVTVKKQIQAQLLHAGKLGAIGEMAAGVAHELNSPLTAILGNSQLLLRQTSADHPDYMLLQDINNCGTRCKNIIKSLLTFSRQDEYKFREYSINEAIQQVMNLLKFQIQKNEISIHLILQDDIPHMTGSQQQIEQIIINLLLNAKDALDSNEILEKNITIESYTDGELVYVAVTDNGMGIEAERIPLIFHPFHTTKDQDKGTGLGLSVSIGIAKDHGGTLEVESNLGQGSRFTLKLPLHMEVVKT